MKKLYALTAFVLFSLATKAQIITFTDPVFKAKLLATSPTSNTAQNLAGVNFKIDANNNGEIEVSEAQQVGSLYMIGSPVSITSFDGILNFINLKTFTSTMNNAPVLNLSGLAFLEYLDCEATHIINLDISNCPNLNYVNASLNQITVFNMAAANNLKTLNLANCQLTTLNVSNFANLEELNCKQSPQLANLIVSGCSGLKKLTCFQTLIPTLDVSGLSLLETLDVYQTGLTAMNLSGCTGLVNLNCNLNELTTLNLDGLTNLSIVFAEGNHLTSVNYAGCQSLKELYIDSNLFTSLDAASLPNLEKLVISTNQLTSLNIAGMAQLKTLDVYDNQLTDIDFSGCSSLLSAQLAINNFVTLDFTECTAMYGVGCIFNPSLTTILAKNGGSLVPGFNNSNTNLAYICANENNVVQIQNSINSSGLVNSHVNSYCSFTPGGTYYTIRGNTKFDALSNGCDAADVTFPNLKFVFTNGTNSGAYVADNSGNYHYDVQAGTHTLTPVLENPNFFTILPASVTIPFPTTASPFVQDFCVTPNGLHPDLDITILPLTVARPGFDSKYLLTYKNKGNLMLSGTINFYFNHMISDVVSTTPVFATQSNNHLTWDFVNLNFLESRSIIVVLNINTPTETPPVNGQDVLTYEADIQPVATDETPEDNATYLHQTVLNSLDPNDKTCVEGTTIVPEMAGKYVHYIVRFENTGTFAAENIVVNDLIDTSKFDVGSLIPLEGSHPFVARINGNKVEFIFENINLPFDDANNDGYVAFKIKLKPTLVLGDTFSNSASIYFDYNAPIVTDPATTTIAILAVKDFEFSDYFSVYPNPANDSLNVKTKGDIKAKSFEIYNILGQLVLAVPNAMETTTVDLSEFSSGSYFLKINSDKGSSNAKFIKR